MRRLRYSFEMEINAFKVDCETAVIDEEPTRNTSTSIETYMSIFSSIRKQCESHVYTEKCDRSGSQKRYAPIIRLLTRLFLFATHYYNIIELAPTDMNYPDKNPKVGLRENLLNFVVKIDKIADNSSNSEKKTFAVKFSSFFPTSNKSDKL
ncbi:hypothetical protein AB6A40_002190 [Gnathostoma spinigerum]|uniref:Uncharacterized protein n=1 Tax=Gnathostoma spinigerum TaxID=75299 RepID=A0ABD6E8G6_9BILA